MVQDSLYFGTGRGAAGAVSAEDWSGFLEVTVTPRFPQGLTTSQASGQWRGVDGSIVRDGGTWIDRWFWADSLRRGEANGAGERSPDTPPPEKAHGS